MSYWKTNGLWISRWKRGSYLTANPIKIRHPTEFCPETDLQNGRMGAEIRYSVNSNPLPHAPLWNSVYSCVCDSQCVATTKHAILSGSVYQLADRQTRTAAAAEAAVSPSTVSHNSQCFARVVHKRRARLTDFIYFNERMKGSSATDMLQQWNSTAVPK